MNAPITPHAATIADAFPKDRNVPSSVVTTTAYLTADQPPSGISIAMLRGEAARLSGTDMPDDHHPLMPRRNPEDIDLGAIKADLEFLIERVVRLPTRKEQALKPLYVMVGSAGIVIGWLELFWRHCL